tara:strand:+ start:528 stop:1841 length:1314 start_codon:yes stop_codon:yes gene_type:complete
MNVRLKLKDPTLFNLIKKEFRRQKRGLELIASENFTSTSVMECLGSVLTNKYSEGLPKARYYGGCEVVDEIETLCQNRCLEAFNLDKRKWGVNVQPYSGSPANLAVYNALLNPHDRLMGLDLPSGGHLTHGFYTNKKKISATSVFYESLPYKIKSDGYIDYEDLERKSIDFNPKLIICGGSAYPRDLNYKRFREISDINKSYLLCDMSHINGLVATNQLSNPFDYCDVISSTTHKTLRGPRAGIIFYKKELEEKINFSVFPMLQGGPHQHQIAGIAHQMLEVAKPEFREYIIQVKKNINTLAEYLISKGYKLSTDGTDTHLILVDLKNKGITGSKIEYLCSYVDISINKNSVYGDKSAISPGGIRIGSCALTTRGFLESDFIKIGELLDRVVNIALEIQKYGKQFNTFKENVSKFDEELFMIRAEVHLLTSKFDFYE